MAQIGTAKIETGSGTVEAPIFSTGDSGSGVYEFWRVETAGGTGFIPLADPSEATHPYVRVQTQNNGVVAVHTQDATITVQVTHSDIMPGSGHDDLTAESDGTLAVGGSSPAQLYDTDGSSSVHPYGRYDEFGSGPGNITWDGSGFTLDGGSTNYTIFSEENSLSTLSNSPNGSGKFVVDDTGRLKLEWTEQETVTDEWDTQLLRESIETDGQTTNQTIDVTGTWDAPTGSNIDNYRLEYSVSPGELHEYDYQFVGPGPDILKAGANQEYSVDHTEYLNDSNASNGYYWEMLVEDISCTSPYEISIEATVFGVWDEEDTNTVTKRQKIAMIE
jgi:hypothetical protein